MARRLVSYPQKRGVVLRSLIVLIALIKEQTSMTMETLRKIKNKQKRIGRTFRTLALQIETTVGFVLGGVVVTAVLMNTNLM